MVAGPPLKCQCPADVYLLLKSSDFISHDLDHPFDLCDDAPTPPTASPPPPETAAASPGDAVPLSGESLYRNPAEETSSDEEDGPGSNGKGSGWRERKEVGYEMELVLKKWFEMPRSQEWRCFVRDKQLIGRLFPLSRRPKKVDGRDRADATRTIRSYLPARPKLLRIPPATRIYQRAS